MKDRGTIEWTRPKLDRLKKNLKTAEEAGDEIFWFEDEGGKKYKIVVNFAKYLIEYLEMHWKAQDVVRRNMS